MGLIILEFLLFAGSLFMMLLILVQRGKGGGLTGALGGMGGQGFLHDRSMGTSGRVSRKCRERHGASASMKASSSA